MVDAGTEGWNGHRYWMAATPYPNSDAFKENPSIWVSDDGDAWAVPAGGANPVEDTPASGYLSDTDIVLHDGTMFLFFRHYDGTNEMIKVRSSTDGVTWTPATTIISEDDAVQRAVSPGVVFDGTTWRMWLVDFLPDPNVVVLYEADDPLGPWTRTGTTNIEAPPHKALWHMDVAQKNGRLYALIMVSDTGDGGTAGGQLWMYESSDGMVWTRNRDATLRGAASGWDLMIYRSTLVARDDGLWDIWYSARGSTTWRIGRTRTLL